MKKNNNGKDINGNLIKESLLDYDNLASKIKENAPDLVKSLLGEQVRQAYASLLNESDEDDDEKEKDYDVEEVDDTMSDGTEGEDDGEAVSSDEDADADGMEPNDTDDSDDTEDDVDDTDDDVDADGEVDGDDEISQTFDKYKTSDGKYDFRNAKDDELVKVYKLLKNDDSVTVVKDDNNVRISDDETGAEYIIDLGNDSKASDMIDDDTDENSMDESRIYEIALDEYDSNVGYTDDYQKEDAMTTDGMSEPSMHGRDIDMGVPHGEEKPWSRQKKSVVPFDRKPTGGGVEEGEINEIKTNAEHTANVTSTSRTDGPNNPRRRKARNFHTAEGGQETGTSESPYKNEAIRKKANRIFEENMKLKAMLGKFQSQLMEAAVTNVNLGGIIKLISENSTSKDEKKEIINRFTNEAHTITESQNLYNRISEELKKKPSVKADINEEKTFGTQEKINESKLYQDESIMDSLGLMHKICK